MAKEVVENFRQMDDTFVRSIKRFNVNLAIMRWWRLSSWKRIQNKTELHQDRHDSQSKHTVGVKMLRRPFIFWLYSCKIWLLTLIHTRSFNDPLSGTTRVSRYQKGKTNLDFTEARDREWQWHRLGHMQVCTSLQTDNHASTPPLSFLQAGCPSCRPTNSVKALKADTNRQSNMHMVACGIIYHQNWESAHH